jgi:hypothetical protein
VVRFHPYGTGVAVARCAQSGSKFETKSKMAEQRRASSKFWESQHFSKVTLVVNTHRYHEYTVFQIKFEADFFQLCGEF